MMISKWMSSKVLRRLQRGASLLQKPLSSRNWATLNKSAKICFTTSWSTTSSGASPRTCTIVLWSSLTTLIASVRIIVEWVTRSTPLNKWLIRVCHYTRTGRFGPSRDPLRLRHIWEPDPSTNTAALLTSAWARAQLRRTWSNEYRKHNRNCKTFTERFEIFSRRTRLTITATYRVLQPRLRQQSSNAWRSPPSSSSRLNSNHQWVTK